MRARVAAATDTGLVRDHNEDAFLVAEPLYAVADGMGGHLGGEVASATALDALAASFAEGGVEKLAEAVRAANDAVFEHQIEDPSVAGMGTTLTAIVPGASSVEIAHVGDSRAYLLRDGELRPLTDDHTLVGEMVREGSLTEDQARVHPRRSILTRALGTEGRIEVDRHSVEARPGDRILLCSDGLSGMIDDAAIRSLLRSEADPQQACDALISAANAAGGADNITVVVVDLLADEDAADAAADPSSEEAAATPDAPEPRRGLFRRKKK